MAATFSIDEVREAFTSDIAGMLGRIEDSLCKLLIAPALEPLAVNPTGPTAFELISDQYHAVAGTSSLVHADTIADLAHLLEDLTARGASSLRLIEEHAINARRIGELCIESVAALHSMLDLELAGRRDEASGIAAALRPALLKAGAVPRGAPAASVAPAAEPAEYDLGLDDDPDLAGFAFDDAPAVNGSAVPDELLGLFRGEAEGLLRELGECLRQLQAAADPATLARAERLSHTLKGAAATVGATVFAGIAEALQDRFEQLAAAPDALTAAELDQLVHACHELARVGELDVALPAASAARPDAAALDDGWDVDEPAQELAFDDDLEGAPAPVADELHQIFAVEAKQELDRLVPLIQQLEQAAGDAAAVDHAVNQIERLFHTLKGAAATVGLTEIATAAAELQLRFEAVASGEAEADAELLGLALAAAHRIARAAGTVLPVRIASVVEPPPRPALADAAVHAETERFFVREAEAVCREVLHLMPRLDPAHDDARATQGSLARLLHRLKGSALLVGQHAVANEALRLQALADSDASGVPLQAALTQGVVRIAQLVGVVLETAPVAAAAPRAAAPRAHRVAVELAVEPRLWEAFQQECGELLEQLDRMVLELERSDRPRDTVAALLRTIHTLKGAINTIGLAPTGRALHHVEDYLEHVLEAGDPPSRRQLATVLLDVQAEVRRHLEDAPTGSIDTARLDSRIASLRIGEAKSTSYSGLEASVASLSASLSASALSASLSASASAGEVSWSRGSESQPREGGLESIERRTLRVSTERLDALMNLAQELVVSRARLITRVDTLRGLHGEIERNRRRLTDTVDRFRVEHEFTLAARGSATSLARPAKADAWSSFTDLELDRYDDVNVLARSLAEIADDVTEMDGSLLRELAAFGEDSDALSGIVQGFQSEVTRARMVPLENLFTRLRLPARDAAEREAKDVRVITTGEDVNLDKAIADALFAPMLHLVRNAVSHGIEAPALRRERGKSAEGTLTMTGRQSAGQIILEVRDDGGGLDLAALRARGAAAGLCRADLPLTDPAIRELVFAPGLSTRDEAADVAGRGVGGEVVKRAVERLNGTIRCDTTPGVGTTFVVTLPVTLAITRAVLVRHRGQRYAIPLYAAERVFTPDDADIVDSAGNRRVRVGEELVPLRRLDEFFDASAAAPAAGARSVVVLRVGDQVLGLQVDHVHGQEEIVVRPLGSLLDGHPLFTGMTVRGTGELVLILDVAGMTAALHRQRTSEAAVAVDGRAANEAAPVAAAPVVIEAGERLRALWVDDSLSVRRVAEQTMLQLGADITMAIDGVDAIAKLRSASFDILFTDLEMPRMHGYELIRELRYLPQYHQMPIVVVSSRSGHKHQRQARDAGATDFLTKPFNEELLNRTLRRWCGDKARALTPRRA